MDQPFIKWILGIMSVVVVAFSAAVYNGQQKLSEDLHKINLEFREEITAISATQKLLVERLAEHRAMPAHGDVLRHIDRLNLQLDQMRKAVDRSDRRWREMQKWMSENARHEALGE